MEFISNTPTQQNTLAIDRSASEDPFYRYRMHRLVVRHLGRDRMTKTALINVDTLASELHVPPSWIVAYLGYSLNAQWKVPKMAAGNGGKSDCTLAGHLSAEELTDRLYDFIDRFVLCPQCRLPELLFDQDDKVKSTSKRKNKKSPFTCNGCGASGFLESANVSPSKTEENFFKFIRR